MIALNWYCIDKMVNNVGRH